MPFEVDSRDLRRLSIKLERLGDQGVIEQDRALKDTRRRSLTFISKDIRSEYPVKVAAVKANLNASPVKDLAYTVSTSNKSISLKNFGRLSQTKKGVAVTIRRGSRTLYRSAFQVASKGGTVFWREKRGEKQVGRLPIKRIGGPTAAQMFKKTDRLKRTRAFISDRLSAELSQRYVKILKRG